MDRKEIEERLKKILIDKLDISAEKIKPESLLVKELGIDSFAYIELVFVLEDEFDIKVSDEEITKLQTVADIVNGIEQKLQDNK